MSTTEASRWPCQPVHHAEGSVSMAAFPRFNPAGWWAGRMAATTRWMESTLEVVRWENMRRAGRRWGWWGAAAGTVIGLLAYAPAPWLAQLVVEASQGRVLLAESSGTVWHGSAVVVLTGGRGSRDAAALPGRLNWDLGWQSGGLRLTLQQDCCVPTPLVLLVQPRWSETRLTVQPGQSGPRGAQLGHWPAAWLTGLGTPWNTLQLGGTIHLSGQQLALVWTRSGVLKMDGQATVVLDNMSSSLSTLDRLGSYRMDVQGEPQGPITLNLSTLDGALQLSGQGELGPRGMRFRGEASATPQERGALDNLLNIIGRRSGDRSVITIG